MLIMTCIGEINLADISNLFDLSAFKTFQIYLIYLLHVNSISFATALTHVLMERTCLRKRINFDFFMRTPQRGGWSNSGGFLCVNKKGIDVHVSCN